MLLTHSHPPQAVSSLPTGRFVSRQLGRTFNDTKGMIEMIPIHQNVPNVHISTYKATFLPQTIDHLQLNSTCNDTSSSCSTARSTTPKLFLPTPRFRSSAKNNMKQIRNDLDRKPFSAWKLPLKEKTAENSQNLSNANGNSDKAMKSAPVLDKKLASTDNTNDGDNMTANKARARANSNLRVLSKEMNDFWPWIKPNIEQKRFPYDRRRCLKQVLVPQPIGLKSSVTGMTRARTEIIDEKNPSSQDLDNSKLQVLRLLTPKTRGNRQELITWHHLPQPTRSVENINLSELDKMPKVINEPIGSHRSMWHRCGPDPRPKARKLNLIGQFVIHPEWDP